MHLGYPNILGTHDTGGLKRTLYGVQAEPPANCFFVLVSAGTSGSSLQPVFPLLFEVQGTRSPVVWTMLYNAIRLENCLPDLRHTRAGEFAGPIWRL